MNNLLEKITVVLKKDPFNIKDIITQDSKIKSLPNWDSLKHLMFLMEIEKTTGIEINPEDIQSISTVGDLMKRIEGHDNTAA